MLADLSRLTARPVLGWAVLVLIALALAALFMAHYKGRNSRSHQAVSALVSPLLGPLARTLASDDAALLALPYANPALQLDAAWRWRDAQRVAVDPARRDALVLQATAESLWFLNDRGPYAYRLLDGDATVSVQVQVRKRSDATRTPDIEWQFAGLLLRDPAGDAWMARENYVFNVVGYCCGELQIETKSTRDGRSSIQSRRWDGGDAELSIRRSGARFVLSARADANAPWQEIAAYDRPDLPRRLQVGVILYAHSEGRGRHDLQAAFRDFAVR